MNVVRFPIEELSADYGDIILDSVSSNVEAIISINGSEVLHEVYSPDILGHVYIRDVGSLAMIYNDTNNVSLDNELDGSSVVLDISLKEGNEIFSSPVTIYCCEAESGDTLSVNTLKQMPLSRLTNKVTGIGRTEFVSFYGDGKIMADVVFHSVGKDDIKTVEIGSLGFDDGKYYRFDVSPSVISTLCGIVENNIIQYTIYKSENDSISFIVDKRLFLNKKTFVFKNIFGAQETFSCTGDYENERKWTRSFGAINRAQRQISRDLLNTNKVNTGLISRDTVGILEDLMNSQYVYYLEEGVLRRISIIEESFKVSSRKDQIVAIEFKYRYSSNNQLQYRTNKKRIFDFTFDESFN